MAPSALWVRRPCESGPHVRLQFGVHDFRDVRTRQRALQSNKVVRDTVRDTVVEVGQSVTNPIIAIDVYGGPRGQSWNRFGTEGIHWSVASVGGVASA